MSLRHLYVQWRRTKGWRMPEDAINCTRPGKWGNSWTMRHVKAWHIPRERARQWLVDKYRQDVDDQGPEFRALIRDELAEKVLVCWCAPGEPCHVQDVLLPCANEGGVT